MLRKWIDKESCSKHKILEKYHKALLGIELIADAENFKKKAFNDDDDGSDDEGETPDLT